MGRAVVVDNGWTVGVALEIMVVGWGLTLTIGRKPGKLARP